MTKKLKRPTREGRLNVRDDLQFLKDYRAMATYLGFSANGWARLAMRQQLQRAQSARQAFIDGEQPKDTTP